MTDHSGGRPRVFIGPTAPVEICEAVARGGGEQVHDPEAAEAFIWLDGDPATLRDALTPTVRWVQLSSAGVDRWTASGTFDPDRVWTSAGPAYASIVAEHALALVLAAAKRLDASIRATAWSDPAPRPLRGATIVLVGSGRIGRALLQLLTPLGVETIAVNRSGAPVIGATRSVAADDLDLALPHGDYVVVTAPSTAQTRHIIGARQLGLMKADAWLVNVARGALVDTDALVAALREGTIGGCALDTTDPEPLPEGHPLWALPGVIVTPHVANPIRTAWSRYATLVEDNVRRFGQGAALDGVVDIDAGY